MAVLDVRTYGGWSDAATSRSEMGSCYCSVSAELPMQSTRISKPEEVSIFLILRALRLFVFVRLGLECSDSGIVLPDCRLPSDSS